MKDEKREILDYLKLVTESTNISKLLRDMKIDDACFYTGRYSLERMQEIKDELKARLKELSKM